MAKVQKNNKIKLISALNQPSSSETTHACVDETDKSNYEKK